MLWAIQWLAAWFVLLAALSVGLGDRVICGNPPAPPKTTHEVGSVLLAHRPPLALPIPLEPLPPAAPDLSGLDRLLRASPQPTGLRGRLIGVDHYELFIASVDELSLCGRVVPAFHDGVAIGFKLLSPPEGTGLVSGDVVLSINRLALNSPERVFEAYERVRAGSRFEVYVKRGAQLVKNTYTLRRAR